LPVCLSVCLFACLPVCLVVCLFVFLPVFLPVCLSVCFVCVLAFIHLPFPSLPPLSVSARVSLHLRCSSVEATASFHSVSCGRAMDTRANSCLATSWVQWRAQGGCGDGVRTAHNETHKHVRMPGLDARCSFQNTLVSRDGAAAHAGAGVECSRLPPLGHWTRQRRYQASGSHCHCCARACRQ